MKNIIIRTGHNPSGYLDYVNHGWFKASFAVGLFV